MSQTVSTLPDDDEPLPRRRSSIDEVHAAHSAAGEYIPPLGSAITPAQAPVSSPTATNGGIPLLPMNSGMSPLGGPIGGGLPQSPMGMPQPMSGGLSSPAPGIPPLPTMPTSSYPQSTMGSTPIGCSTGMGSAMMNQQTMQMAGMSATAQVQAGAGLAQTSLDKQLLDDQLKKEDEHWVKAYWRPCAGWLYMMICFMDFVGFPLISMFLPIFFKKDGITASYVAWQSLTLSNGGLIHLAFGAILGVAAYSRGQEKISGVR